MEQRPSSTPTSDIADTVRSWYGRQSRRRLFIAFLVLLALLFVVAIVITLVFLFAFQKDHHNHAYTPVTLITPQPQTSTAFPYLSGYVVGTSSYYVPLGTVTSLVPDTRVFQFRNHFLSYGNDTVSLFNNTAAINIPLHLDEAKCSSCTLLAIDDMCTTTVAHHCNTSQAIYCCSKCVNTPNFCHVKGISYEFFDDMVENRISSDAELLLITTASHTTSSCALQTHRISADGFTYSGPIQMCVVPPVNGELASEDAILTTTTLSPGSAISADILTIVDSNGGVVLYNLTSKTILNNIPMNIEIHNVLSISTTAQNDFLLVAVLQPYRFYALRLHLTSGCLAVLENYYQSFYFSGKLCDSSWTGDTLMLWYVDRDGVNIAQFQFKWNSDSRC